MPWIEGIVILLPENAGGRSGMVMPREGSYEPYARIAGDDQLLHVRFIEGPPTVLPGESARVVLEFDDEPVHLRPGTELELVEDGTKLVGLITVSRLVSSTIPTI
jgi:hypothetical protein